MKMHNLIPKKERIFITKIINPKKEEKKNKGEENKIHIIPKISVCYTSKYPLIEGKTRYLTMVSNGYYFCTKLHMNKERMKTLNNLKINKNNKYPCKIYRKAIVSPNKINLFRTNKKLGKIKKNKYDSVGKNKKDENLSKRVKKKERISLISKDKPEANLSQKENSKDNNNNLIVKENNNNEFDDDLKENRIDISIQFSNTPISINYNENNKNNINFKKPKFNSTSKKKNKNITDSLYKDLHEINNKLENRNDYLKKHYHLDYPKHIGDEQNCPICKEVRKKGKKMEKEKGLFSAFSFRNFKTIKRKSLNKLKLSQLKKNQNYKIDLLSDDERKKNNIFGWNNNINNLSQQNLDFRKKYMEFNGMNRLNRINRYGSVGNYNNYKSNKVSRNENNKALNDGKIYDKSEDIFNNSEYPLLKNYFHNNDYKTNDYYY